MRGSDPAAWKTINATFADVPEDERYAILPGNAERLFGFGASVSATHS
jgi:hypothetical protein